MEFNFKVRDPISALTHFLAFLSSIPILIILVVKASNEATIYHVVSLIIFGISLILLYGASTVYHTLVVPNEKLKILKKIDHMMIFVLIAGTYTPICLIPLRGAWGWTLLVLVWGFAIFGIILKAFWINAPRWLSTSIYVVMGWLVVIAFMPLEKAVPFSGILLLVLGGVVYTIGALVYALKWPKFNFKYWGFHEIFHIFVMLGSAFHIIFMFNFII